MLLGTTGNKLFILFKTKKGTYQTAYPQCQEEYAGEFHPFLEASFLLYEDEHLLQYGMITVIKTFQQTSHERTGLLPTLSQMDDISITDTV